MDISILLIAGVFAIIVITLTFTESEKKKAIAYWYNKQRFELPETNKEFYDLMVKMEDGELITFYNKSSIPEFIATLLEQGEVLIDSTENIYLTFINPKRDKNAITDNHGNNWWIEEQDRFKQFRFMITRLTDKD